MVLQFCIKHIERVVENQHYPLMDEYICHLVEDIEDVTDREQERAIYKAHCLEVIAPGYNYFKNNLLAGDVGACLPLYKAVRLGNPAYVKHALAVRGIDALKAEVHTLLVMKCVNQERIEALLSELPLHVLKVVQTMLGSCYLGHHRHGPHWQKSNPSRKHDLTQLVFLFLSFSEIIPLPSLLGQNLPKTFLFFPHPQLQWSEYSLS